MLVAVRVPEPGSRSMRVIVEGAEEIGVAIGDRDSGPVRVVRLQNVRRRFLGEVARKRTTDPRRSTARPKTCWNSLEVVSPVNCAAVAVPKTVGE